MPHIAVIQGPNLNRLGDREPHLYGTDRLDTLHRRMQHLANELGHQLSTFQSNSEGALIDHLHTCIDVDFFIINFAAYTHTSIALRDAMLIDNHPFVEVHLTNVAKREPFRHPSYFSDIAIGTISGLGGEGYLLALRYAHHYLSTHHNLQRS
jgi:3-dehydroquinate dehydratase-2